MATYYDWKKTLSDSANVTVTVGAHDSGKTYGLRKYKEEQFSLRKGGVEDGKTRPIS